MNEVRIIAGQCRGRRIHFHANAGLRPSLDAVRETLFNWLMFKVKDANCLDAFAGSGALGCEALSRFAHRVLFIEHDRDSAAVLKKNIALLNLQHAGQVHYDSSLRYLAKEKPEPFDLIFLDPPFQTDLLEKSLKWIAERGWLAPEGLIYFEAERQFKIEAIIERQFSLYRHKTLGEVQFGLLSHSQSISGPSCHDPEQICLG